MRVRCLQARKDDGFSLTELIVSLTLLGFVLALAYSISQVVSIGQRNADRQSLVAREITYPLTRISEILIQNHRIEVSPAPTGMTLSVRTDQDLNDQQEQHNFRLVTEGGDTYIEQQVFLLNSSGVRVLPVQRVARWGTRVTNVDAGVPLFRYFDASGAPIADMSRVPDAARSVEITIRSTVDGRVVQDSVRAAFRNRDS
ncbi:MAG: prepilin-type N-terminal cleavage/methylation domain-containing protein [Actinobacteria bacterium]|nr:prepilin-type N-terminal cleavage/methylation domain-containing protein [Actinomycetota bacterium]